jgi:sugar lactone lactonase YvrE
MPQLPLPCTIQDARLKSRLHPDSEYESQNTIGQYNQKKLLCWLMAFLLTLIPVFSQTAYAQTNLVSTFAGSTPGFVNGIGTNAQFNNPVNVCTDGVGNLFVADFSNHSIRQIVIATGEVTTLAGNGTQGFQNGFGSGAQFSVPIGSCSDGAGNLFVADFSNSAVRKIVIATGEVTTLAGGTVGSSDGIGTAAQFRSLNGICFDGAGNLFIADRDNHRIRKIVIATGEVTTLAGSTSGFADGTGAAAQFSQPTSICSDGMGNLYVGENGNNRVRKIVIATATVTTLAGSFAPNGICYDGAGNLFIAEQNSSLIRKIVLATGVATTVAGSIGAGYVDGIGTVAKFNQPTGLCSIHPLDGEQISKEIPLAVLLPLIRLLLPTLYFFRLLDACACAMLW